ncbi:hypothetical protein [Wenzhouxiangella sediminis]|uniref:Right-handed parallel beta-helix repeat-containing protein n=1 Tax=Wenzhouxiangella sediminis TaxID=1792836 RepID=A0A3E1K491_9GAMM|nr:hypothetical protein [Wenzhouxiangella sediminis]RFF28873.1 hypothetical protein DZC52_15255 [Wenzhouxiangella sediminis]
MFEPMTRIMRLAALALLAALTLTPALAWPAVFCVQTSEQLRQAMTTAGSNGQDDIIRIHSGTYPAPAPQPFIYSSDGAFDLDISGGWSPGFDATPCVYNDGEPGDTLLDGEGNRLVMSIQGQAGEAGEVRVQNLTIASALASPSSGALSITGPASGFGGEILVDRVKFSGNQGPAGGSAIRITGGNKVTVRNSIFAFNSTGNGQGVVFASMSASDQGFYFINNSLTYSFHDVSSPSATTTSGLHVNLNNDGTSQSRAYIANNLFWANETDDTWLGGVGTTYVYNNNFFFDPPASDFSDGNMSVDPQLVQIGVDFTPAAGSPLIDQGRSQPTPPFPVPRPFELDWSYGLQDFDGGGTTSRLEGANVDIGAVESPFKPDGLFQDRFEP